MRSVILIGASGFLGQHMMRSLKENGYSVHAVIHRSMPIISPDSVIYGGIKALDHKLIDRINPAIVIHCARPTYPRLRRLGRTVSAIHASRLNNMLLKQLSKTSCRPMLVFSSGSLVYGNSDYPHKENLNVNPVSYARQYYRGEKPFTAAARDASYPVSLFRLPWMLGKGSWFKWFYHDPAINRQVIPIFGTGDNIMEIIDIRDAVKVMLDFSIQGRNGVINIPGSARLSQKAFVEKVSKISGANVADFKVVFSRRLEKEAIEAFTSNILLSSSYQEMLDQYEFIPIDDSLHHAMS